MFLSENIFSLIFSATDVKIIYVETACVVKCFTRVQIKKLFNLYRKIYGSCS